MSTLVAAVALLYGSAAVEAGRTPEERCRVAVASASRDWLVGVVRARQQCVRQIVKGRISGEVDCIRGVDERRLARKIPRLGARLASEIGRQCAGVNLRLLSFPGPCTDRTGDPDDFDARDLENCVLEIGGEVVERLLAVEYPPDIAFTRGPEGRCLVGAAGRSFAMVADALRSRSRCLVGQELDRTPAGVDCRAELPPLGPGTADDRLDRRIARSEIILLTGVTRACARADFDDLGFALGPCPQASAGAFSIFDLKSCNFDVNRRETLRYLGVSFPTDPACGNGVREGEEEECDEGLQNSDTVPGACRSDCRLPFCGDGVVDAASRGETCDDGNLTAGDGCSPTCTAEVCGDGLLCDAPTCTSGPTGGREQCDDGGANSDTAPDACRRDCALPSCGDRVTDPGLGEACDDGNDVSEDGCSGSTSPLGPCQTEECGDSVVQVGLGEQCDDGSDNADVADRCRSDCRSPRCGDGIVDPGRGEQCDDGNTDPDDGCTDDCTICGDGEVAGNEECDDGAANSDVDLDGCSTSCTTAVTCVLTTRVTTSEVFGSLQYRIDYTRAGGEFVGTGTTVSCRSLVQGAFAQFNDAEEARELRESIIATGSFAGPLEVAACDFRTHDRGLGTGDFDVAVIDARSPGFEVLEPAMTVASVVCE